MNIILTKKMLIKWQSKMKAINKEFNKKYDIDICGKLRYKFKCKECGLKFVYIFQKYDKNFRNTISIIHMREVCRGCVPIEIIMYPENY